MKKVFLSFADSALRPSAKRILQQAKKLEVYDRIIVADEHDLEKSFRKKFKSKLVAGSRGYGYWAWKPQIILQTLRKMENGDVLQYTDVGCHLNPKGNWRLLEYFSLTDKSNSGILAFQAKAPELPLPYDGRQLFDLPDFQWIKGDLLDYFHIRNDESIIKAQTIGATIIFIKKTADSLRLVKEWCAVADFDFSLIDDSPSKSPNLPGFIEHRHDQAIFSLLCKINKVETLSAFEYWYPSSSDYETPDWEMLEKFPIHVKRDKVFLPENMFVERITRKVSSLLNRITRSAKANPDDF